MTIIVVAFRTYVKFLTAGVYFYNILWNLECNPPTWPPYIIDINTTRSNPVAQLIVCAHISRRHLVGFSIDER